MDNIYIVTIYTHAYHCILEYLYIRNLYIYDY